MNPRRIHRIACWFIPVALLALCQPAVHSQTRIYPNSAPDKGSVQLAWDPSPGPDIATYNIYYGTNGPGYYTVKTTVGNVTNCTITGLTRGVNHYFVATAANTAGLESDPSNEVQYTPVTKPGKPGLLTRSNLVASVNIEGAPHADGPWTVVADSDLTIDRPAESGFYRARMDIAAPVVGAVLQRKLAIPSPKMSPQKPVPPVPSAS